MAARVLLVWAMFLLAASAMGAESQASAPARERVLAVFDFATPKGQEDLGKKTAFQFTQKLKRTGRFTLVDSLSIEGILRQNKFDPYEATAEKAAEFIREKISADLAVFGRAEQRGQAVSLKFRVLEITPAGFEVLADVDRQLPHFRDTTEFIQVTVWALSGEEPPKKLVAAKELSGNLVANGDFEKAGPGGAPEGWGPIDNLTTFWVDGGGGHGKVLRVDTDVNLDQWQKWRAELAAGAKNSDAPGKTPTTPPKYDTVAGNNGMHFFGPMIAVKPGAAYQIDFDAKGIWAEPIFFAKVFVKGYADVGGQDREVWNMFKALRFKTAGREWEHLSRTFHPSGGSQWMRVVIYSYWPPYETYMYDNVRIVEVEEKWTEDDWQKAPLERRSP